MISGKKGLERPGGTWDAEHDEGNGSSRSLSCSRGLRCDVERKTIGWTQGRSCHKRHGPEMIAIGGGQREHPGQGACLGLCLTLSGSQDHRILDHQRQRSCGAPGIRSIALKGRSKSRGKGGVA